MLVKPFEDTRWLVSPLTSYLIPTTNQSALRGGHDNQSQTPKTMATAMFNAKTTADEVAAYFKAANISVRDKTFMVTGGNCGLGLETSRCIAANGGIVIVLSRSAENGMKAIELVKEKHPDAEITSMVIDLSSFKSIRACAAAYIETERPLHALINNAGIMACPLAVTEDGFESQIGVNHFGHFLLTDLLLPVLAKTGTKECPSRVVNLSSMAEWLFTSPEGIQLQDLQASKSYDPWQRYGQSKLANILFTRELNARCAQEGKNVISLSVHPGAITETNLSRHASFIALWHLIRNLTLKSLHHIAFGIFMKNVQQGAATTMFTALSPDVVPGEYYEDCHLSKALNPKSADAELSKQLWNASAKAILVK